MNAMICFAVFGQTLKLPWGDIFAWFPDVIQSLTKRWQTSDHDLAESHLSRLLSLLLKALERTSDDAGRLRSFLDETLLFDILSLQATILCTTSIRSYVQQILGMFFNFCKSRMKPMPLIQEESQDEYAEWTIDLSPEALDTVNAPDPEVIGPGAIAKSISNKVVPALHKLISQFSVQPGEEPTYEEDQWLEIWLESVSVSVHFDVREWRLYTGQRTHSWCRIVDDNWREHVHARWTSYTGNQGNNSE